nr:ATP-binding protein [Mariprofundus sp. EBB-1]
MSLPLFTFFALFIDGGIGNTGIYWGLIFPFLAFLLMGIRLGWFWVAAFVLFHVVALVSSSLGLVDLTYSDDTLRYIPTMFLCFSLIACAFQLQLERRQTELVETNTELKKREHELCQVQDDLEKTVQRRTSELKSMNTKLSQEIDDKIEALQQKECAELKYVQAQKMETVGTLVGGIAHDFNNMLSGITANIYLIQRQIDSPEILKRLDDIGDLSMHAADIIRQLMTYARKDRVVLTEFDLHAVIQQSYKLARVSIPAHIRCELSLPEDVYMIKGDETQIQQILMNLMNNARDSTAGVDNPFINVALSKSKQSDAFLNSHPEARGCDYVILSVEDNGCGIPKEQLSKIYEPFYSTKEVDKGTGLGLSMVYGAVKSHGGFLNVVSHLHSGTCFSIYLPLENSIHTLNDAQHALIKEGHGETILLVDDDDSLLEVTERLLKTLGYIVLTASNGVQAVETYERNRDNIDLVLMDVVMPQLGGKLAAERIHKLNPDMKVVFMTGYDPGDDATCEMILDNQMVLSKPLAVEKLSQTIRYHLT